MIPWRSRERRSTHATNANVAVSIFFLLFIVWVAFQVWSRLGGGAPPVGLDPMVMAALGVAITTKSVEKKAEDQQTKQAVSETKQTVSDQGDRLWDLEEMARDAHPAKAAKRLPPPTPKPSEEGTP